VTYDYVARLQALSCLVAEPGRHGLKLPNQARFVPLAAILMDDSIRSVEQYAAANGRDAAELRRLNPGYKSGRIVEGVPRLVLTPFPVREAIASQSAGAAQPARMVAVSNGSLVAKEDSSPAIGEGPGPGATHLVKSGESLWTIARRYRIPLEQLRRANGLGKESLVRPGQTLKLQH
jgi:membrane-bound lytic murein transglycosylase D